MTDFAALNWGFIPALVALSALHYLCSALALRAVAGHRLPLWEATLTQLTAATANRLTPGGIGAAAVNARYLTVRGLPAPRAIASVAALHAATALSDLLLFLGILAVGTWTGGGGAGLLSALGLRAASAISGLPLVWLFALAFIALAAVVIAWLRQGPRRMLGGLRETLIALRQLLRRPRDLLLTLAACAATTLVLSIAFTLSVLAVPGASAPGELVTLLAVYFIGATAGSAVPVPAGIGTTEAAMIAALSGAGVPPGHAVRAVVLFRVTTFWAPVPIGVVAARTLRRRRAPADPGQAASAEVGGQPATAVPARTDPPMISPAGRSRGPARSEP